MAQANTGNGRVRLHRWRIHHLGQTESTQDALRDALRQSPEAAVCVRADEQRAGRGRRGRHWVSPRGGLWCSLNVNASKPDPFHTLLLATAALEWAIDWARRPNRLFIKWPNDLMVESQRASTRIAKWGGVMAESQSVTDGVSTIVFGLGLNLDLDPARLPETEPPSPAATSLRAEFGASPSPRAALSAILPRFEELLGLDARSRGDAVRRVSPHVRTLSAPIQWLDDKGTPCRGTALALTEHGALVVQHESGRRDTLVAGEVSHVRAR